MAAEQEIRAFLDARLAGLAAKDAEAVVRGYAGDAVLFDLPPPLVQPLAELHDPARLQVWFDSWDGPIAVEQADVAVRTAGDLAVAFGLLHLWGKRTDGSEGDFWFRSTLCLERRDGGWSIVHEHNSFPMLMDGSGKAATEQLPGGGRTTAPPD
jgi:ketosteroid isomerase-like protein